MNDHEAAAQALSEVTMIEGSTPQAEALGRAVMDDIAMRPQRPEKPTSTVSFEEALRQLQRG